MGRPAAVASRLPPVGGFPSTHMSPEFRRSTDPCDLFPEIGACSEIGEGSDICPEANRERRVEWRSLAKAEERSAIIGRYQRERPSLEAIRSSFRTSLRIEGEMSIDLRDARTVLIRLAFRDDWRRVIRRNRATVAGAIVWFSRWLLEWRPWRDSSFVPVWLHLPNLPFHLFDLCMLNRIRDPIGRVLALDTATERRSRPNVATVRVEIDLRRPLLRRLWIAIGGEGNGF
nr:TMV resistance protein N-like [Ipomoea batatas]